VKRPSLAIMPNDIKDRLVVKNIATSTVAIMTELSGLKRKGELAARLHWKI